MPAKLLKTAGMIRQSCNILHLYMENGPLTEQELISACIRQDINAQRALYNRFAPIVLGICRRYLSNEMDARDALAETMLTVLTKLDEYRSEGSFEGWVKKIAINESLMLLRKLKRFELPADENIPDTQVQPSVISALHMADIIRAMDSLPAGYRTVFNLYAIEGYKHREIAALLGISINTSKSQYALAKVRLQQWIKSHHHGG
jgi:RNA polymerase sigma-70 factor (ECF subfamily)